MTGCRHFLVPVVPGRLFVFPPHNKKIQQQQQQQQRRAEQFSEEEEEEEEKGEPTDDDIRLVFLWVRAHTLKHSTHVMYNNF